MITWKWEFKPSQHCRISEWILHRLSSYKLLDLILRFEIRLRIKQNYHHRPHQTKHSEKDSQLRQSNMVLVLIR